MLDADRMIEGVRRRLATRLGDRLAPLPRDRELIPLAVNRSPYFCSGCPHNHSTRVPEGAMVCAGIGCHTMALLVDDDRIGDIVGVTAMGNEGAAWIGMSEFVDTEHLFQNLGDGTYFHSGQLAIQAAVAAGVNVTYKILFNGTVAMTGGQDPQGGVAIPQVVQMLEAYGVAQILITTDDVARYHHIDLPSDVDVWDRSRLIEAQERLAAIPGVTVLIHDQPCAAETRRKRKRGLVTTPQMRVAINQRICEGCGDCGRASSCLSVEPVDTPFGRKTQINQHTCNLDYSCLDGDCPSFMTVTPSRRGGGLFRKLARRRRRTATTAAEAAKRLPPPPTMPTADSWSIRMAGVGGTGVVTAAQIIGTAAMLSGRKVRGLDQTGLSQKAGPVISDLRMTAGTDPTETAPPSNHLGDQQADAIIGFDQLVASSARALEAAAPGRTIVVGSSSESPTGAMIIDPEIEPPDADSLADTIAATSAGPGHWFDAARLADVLTGSAVGANIMVVGAAVQTGAIPVAPEFVEEAIRLNGVAVDANLAAFRWGRAVIADPATVHAVAEDTQGSSVNELPAELAGAVQHLVSTIGADDGLAATITRYAADLVGYQDAAYSRAYVSDLTAIAEREASVRSGSTVLTAATAESLYQLMAYKDEYEVARLMLSDDGLASIADDFDEPVRGKWRLHPPILKSMGLKRKIAIPTWTAPAFRLLARGKRFRGSKLDVFGRARVRRIERQLIDEYRHALGAIATNLGPENFEVSVELARLPQAVRGYEDLKLVRAEEYRERSAALLMTLEQR